jgi:type IV secretory pathway TrbF-like protein
MNLDPSPFLERPRYLSLLGSEARLKRTWLVAFFAALGALVLSVGALVHLATTSRVESVVVLVDELGRADLLGPAERLPAAERERVVRSQVGLLIRNLRSVYPDRAAQAEMLRRAYALLTPEAAGRMNRYFAEAENDPRSVSESLSREVRVRSVGPIPGTQSWRVQWTEIETPRGAGKPRESAWEAYVAIREAAPVTVREAEDNPLGLRVSAIEWTPVTQETKP